MHGSQASVIVGHSRAALFRAAQRVVRCALSSRITTSFDTLLTAALRVLVFDMRGTVRHSPWCGKKYNAARAPWYLRFQVTSNEESAENAGIRKSRTDTTKLIVKVRDPRVR